MYNHITIRLFLVATIHCLLTTENAISQTYVPFPDSNAVWIIGWCGVGSMCVGEPMLCYPSSEYQYTLGADTIIGVYSYKKLYKSGNNISYTFDPSTNCYTSSSSYFYGYAGSIRQDIPNKKVYFVPPSNSTDTLLYDFDLNVGDTLTTGYLYNNNQYVTAIDSTLDQCGIYRKTFYINDSGAPYTEGIGSLWGLLEPTEICVCDYSWGMSCFSYANDTCVDSSSCQLIINTIQEVKKVVASIKVYPNPSSGNFTILLPEDFNELNQSIEISIFDNFGKVVKEINNIPSGFGKHTVEIDISSLPSGLYLCRLKSGNGHAVAKFSVIK
ncbi:T9SS type A sorting domain-containing protein [bacterium AH-315-M05]|nr:T9SS type A sorting domain-containing protein [bacterium AH-315-M05]